MQIGLIIGFVLLALFISAVTRSERERYLDEMDEYRYDDRPRYRDRPHWGKRNQWYRQSGHRYYRR